MSDNYDDRKFDEAMKTQMRQQLGESICTVKFKKADDTEREMKCTTNIRFIPEENIPGTGRETHDERLELSRGNDNNLFVVLILRKLNGGLLDMKGCFHFIIQELVEQTTHL